MWWFLDVIYRTSDLYHVKDMCFGVSRTPKITTWVNTGREFCPFSTRAVWSTPVRSRMHDHDRARHTATEPHGMTHTIACISPRTYPNHQRSCRAAQGITSGRIGRAWQPTTNNGRFHTRVPTHATRKQARPSPDAVDSASAATRQLGPLLLRVVLDGG